MKLEKRIFLGMLSMGATLLVQCSLNNPADVAHTADNPAIAGILYNVDHSVAKNATVQIRAKSILADTSKPALSKMALYSRSTTTDGSGKYSFDADLEPDIYVIDAHNGSNAALIDSVRVVKKDSNVVLAAATLKPGGAISGKVRLPQGGDPQNVYVLAFGIDRFAKVKADSSFLFKDLAEGVYTLRLISSLTSYGSLDTGGIEVFSAETTAIKTVELPCLDVSVPRIALVYDTMQRVVTLRWNRLTAVNVKGYSIYRKNIDANETFAFPCKTNPANDTVFIDSSGLQDRTYEYCVSAMLQENREGTKSNIVKIKIESYLSVDTVFSSVVTPFGLAVSSSGDIYIPNATAQEIQVFDSMMQQKRIIGSGIWQYQNVCLSDDKVFALQLDQTLKLQNVLVFTTAGTLVDTFITTDQGLSIDANKNLLAIAHRFHSLDCGGSIAVFSVDGTLKSTWNFDDGLRCLRMCIGDSNKIFVALEDQTGKLKKIATYDQRGKEIAENAIESKWGTIEAFTYDAQRQLLYVAYRSELKIHNENGMYIFEAGIVTVFDRNNSLIAYYNVLDGIRISTVELQENGSLFIGVIKGPGANTVSKSDRIIKIKPLQK